MTHTRGPEGEGPDRPQATSADRKWVGRRERGVRERRGTPAPDTPTQSETGRELMNEQAKGPGNDSCVWPRRASGPALDPDTCCGQGM